MTVFGHPLDHFCDHFCDHFFVRNRQIWLLLYHNRDSPFCVLLIERADGIIDVCEMKYSRYEYRQDKDDSRNLANKIADFEEETNTRYNIQTVLITTWGMKENLHSDEFQKVLTMNDLFVENTEDS